MNIIIISLLETIGLGVLALLIFIISLLMPDDGVEVNKEFRFGQDGFCIRIEKEKDMSNRDGQ